MLPLISKIRSIRPTWGKSVRFSSTFISDMKERGLIKEVTESDENKGSLQNFISNNPDTTVYAGFDPTAESLHVGNLMIIIGLAHFQRAGISPIALIGGATGMIGDPSGKSQERVLLSEDTITHNSIKIKSSLEKCLNKGPITIVNNYDWYKNMNMITYLRDVGKQFRVGTMLTKESVKNRLESKEGISFTEFSYQTLQSYDFYQLNKQYNCNIQLGGSDQWGNITAGCEFIHKSINKNVFGVTVPLLTNSSGQKIGKSAGVSGTIWLSDQKTSVYDFYQYFLRTEDVDVIKFLKLFTFLPLNEIEEINKKHNLNPEKRIAQKILADEITTFVHGVESLKYAQGASTVLFNTLTDQSKLSKLTLKELNEDLFKDVPKITVDKSTSFVDLPTLLASIKMSPSKAEVRRTIINGGVYLNNKRVENVDYKLTQEDLIDNSFCLLRTGKKTYKFVVFQ